MNRFIAKSLFLPTFGWNILLGRVLKVRHWWDEVEPRVFLGARPLRRDIPKMSKLGIRGVVNMCEEFSGHPQLYETNQIEQLWLPTTDFHHPTIEQVQEGVEFIESKVSKGQGVYIHCKAGRARSATVLICWLMKYRNLSPQLAQEKLLLARPHTNRHLLERPVVQQFIGELGR